MRKVFTPLGNAKTVKKDYYASVSPPPLPLFSPLAKLALNSMRKLGWRKEETPFHQNTQRDTHFVYIYMCERECGSGCARYGGIQRMKRTRDKNRKNPTFSNDMPPDKTKTIQTTLPCYSSSQVRLDNHLTR